MFCKKIISLIIIFILILPSMVMAEEICINDRLSSLHSFSTPLHNANQALACCGKSKEDPGYFLSTMGKAYSHQACLARYRNGLPEKNPDNEFGFLQCIGAGMMATYESLKENISGLWDMVSSPLELASDMAELGKMLVDSEGREKLYQFIKNSLRNKIGNISNCLSEEELEEELCKMGGQFVSNFIPPALMIKALVNSIKMRRATSEMSALLDKTVKQRNEELLKVGINSKVTASRNFSDAEIKKNSLLSNRERVAEFERLLGVPAGTFAKDSEKYKAIIAAHNLDGKVGTLTFGQIKDRVRLLREKGFSDDEIRMGLDAGIFGRLEASTPMSRDAILSSLPTASHLGEAKVLSKVDSTKYGSGQTLFRGDNNEGIEILEVGGEKVFSKVKYTPERKDLSPGQVRVIQESFVNESQFAKKLSDLGIGPKYYGAQIGSDGKYTIATQYIDGYEVHLGDDVANIKDIKLFTIYQMKERALKAVEHGIDPFDLQFRVDKTGTPFIIDPEHFSTFEPSRKQEILDEIEESFGDLMKQKKAAKGP